MTRFDQLRKYNATVYYPVNTGLSLFIKFNGLDKMTVDFDGSCEDPDIAFTKLYVLVRDVLAGMSEDEQAHESERFFIYLLGNPRRDCRAYLEPLLSYFHIIGYLKFKKHIYNDNKQKIVRYRVVFKNKLGEQLFVKRYSSLAQLSDDIGKKMTSLHYQLYRIKP